MLVKCSQDEWNPITRSKSGCRRVHTSIVNLKESDGWEDKDHKELETT